MDQADEADGQVTQCSHDLRAVSGAQLVAVLIEDDVTDPVELVLDSPVPLDPGGNLLGLGIGHGQGADPGRPLSSSGFCGGWFIWCWLFLVVGVGCPGGFVLGGGSLADGGVRANGALPVDLLGGGEHGRRRCPPRGPGQRMSSALYSELSASARAKPKGTRYLVGGPGWSGAGPAGVGAGVLPLSLDDPGGARVTCGSRALVTADKGNDPPQNGRGLTQAWVRGPVRPPADPVST